MTRPWTAEQINEARAVPFSVVLSHLGAYVKRDTEYQPLEVARRSVRIHVGLNGRDFRFILTGEKWVNELMPSDFPARGGGGAIDFVRHLLRANFAYAVKVCLDAKRECGRAL